MTEHTSRRGWRAGAAGRRAGAPRWRAAALAAALAGTALLATACGGSHTSGQSAIADQRQTAQMDKFAQCMRGHGEPDFYFPTSTPAPSSTGPTVLGIMGYNVPMADIQQAQLQSAMSSCKNLMPSGPPTPPITQQQKDHLLKHAACIRAHGYPAYPDPTFSGGLVAQPVPASIDVNSPQFQAVQNACSA
jgi:hypothetical protein